MNKQKGTSIILVSILATLTSILGFISHQYPKEYAQYVTNTGQHFGSGGQVVQSITVNTSSPLGGGGAVALGGSLTLTCATCAAFAFPFTANSWGNSTSTTIGFSNGLISNASSTIVSLTIGNATSTSFNVSGGFTAYGATSTINNLATSVFTAVNATSSNAFNVGGGGLIVNAASSTITQLTVSALTLGTALSVPNGGTGQASFTSNGVLYGNGASGLNVTSQGVANSVLWANAGSPSFTTSPTTTNLTATGNLNVTGSSTFSNTLSIGNNTTISGNLFVTGSTTVTAPITLQGSATSTQDFTVLGKFANKQGSSTVNMTGTTLIDFNTLGTRQRWIATGNTQLVLNATSSNPLAGMTFLIDVCQDSVGGRTITFATPQAIRWDGTNGTTSMTTTANNHQEFWGFYDGVTQMNHIVGSSTPTGCF